MNLVFLMTNTILDLCFAPADLARLGNHRVLVSGESDPAHLGDFWQRHATDADLVITGWKTPPLTDAMLDLAPRLRGILHAAGSMRHILPRSVWRRDLRVASAREALAIGVAETTLGMIIAGLKGFFPAARFAREGGWLIDNDIVCGHRIREMFQSTIGVIGLSKSGRHLIRLLRNFEVRILVTDPHVTASDVEELGAEPVELDELVGRSDVVVLLAPSLPETRGMLGVRQFRLMRDGSVFINTARGEIVDEVALVEELESGRITAFVDVTHPEPPARDHPFRKLPNVVLTPHLAGAVGNGCLRIGRSIVDQVLEFGAGQTMHGEISEEEWGILA
jgi:phosphoglycerate dehydrogenase-like enzyme